MSTSKNGLLAGVSRDLLPCWDEVRMKMSIKDISPHIAYLGTRSACHRA